MPDGRQNLPSRSSNCADCGPTDRTIKGRGLCSWCYDQERHLELSARASERPRVIELRAERDRLIAAAGGWKDGRHA